MKFSLLIISLMLSTGLFAQDSIPHFAELSKEVFQCLSNKDYGCIENKMISVQELMQLMSPKLNHVAKKKSSSILSANIDTIYARAKQLEIDWNRVALISISDSTVDKNMLSEYGIAVAQCTIKFSEGENIYGIEYGLRFLNKQWKIEELHPYIVVYNKDGHTEGVMRQDGYDMYMDGYNHPSQKYLKKHS